MTEERKEQYKTLLIIAAGFALIGWRTHHPYIVIIAAVIVVSGLLSPYLLRKIAEIWMWIGEKIGAVTSRIILSIVFIFFLTPISFFYRAFSNKAKEYKNETYFIERNYTYTAADLEKIF
jgi:hypothetical protein